MEVLDAGRRHIGLSLALPAAAHVDDAGYAQIVEEDRLVIRRRLVERCAAEEESRRDGATIPDGDAGQIAHVANLLKRNGSQSRSFPNDDVTEQRSILSQEAERLAAPRGGEPQNEKK